MTDTFCLIFLSSHVFTALEFHSNYFGILLWKIEKPRDYNEIKPTAGKISQKYKPIRHCFVIFWKYLLSSYVNKFYDNCNKVSCLENYRGTEGTSKNLNIFLKIINITDDCERLFGACTTVKSTLVQPSNRRLCDRRIKVFATVDVSSIVSSTLVKKVVLF